MRAPREAVTNLVQVESSKKREEATSRMSVLDGASPIGPEDVAAAEERLGFALPEQLVRFCLLQNGGLPDRDWFFDGDGDEHWVNRFWPIEPAGDTSGGGIVGVHAQLAGEGLIPASSLPFASDAGGNPFLLDRHTGRVWFMPLDEWDQDETPEQNWARSGRTVVDSFQAFIDGLTDEAPDWARD